MQELKWQLIAESLDSLMRIDIPARGIIPVLYQAAREKAQMPLTLAAVRMMKHTLKKGDIVLLTTGWIDQPVAAPGFGETDGPIGTVVLARALRQALEVCPVIVTDASLVDGMKAVAQAGGFHCLRPDELHKSVELGKLMTMAVIPYPVDYAAAEAAAAPLLDELKPALCIAIERGGLNEAGRIHNMAGRDTSATQAKVDYLFQQANTRGIKTIGVGDGGNEIGMANIRDTIQQEVAFGAVCDCPCKRGLSPSTPVNLLVAATISNWGCYALSALLLASCGKAELIHTAEREQRLIAAAAAAGFHDAIYGGVDWSVDGCALPTHMSLVSLMKEAVEQGEKRYGK